MAKALRPRRKKTETPKGQIKMPARNGPAILLDSKMFELVCSGKFASMESTQSDMAKVINDINAKVNDGFGNDIEHLRNSLKSTNRILLFILFVGFFGIASMIFSSFQLVQGNTESMMEIHKKIDSVQTSVNVHSLLDHPSTEDEASSEDPEAY